MSQRSQRFFRNLLCCALLSGASAGIAGCELGDGPGGTPPPGGFSVGVALYDASTGMMTGWNAVNNLTGNWNADQANAVGSVKSFGPIAGGTPVYVSGGRAPAIWSGSGNTSCQAPFYWTSDPVALTGVEIIAGCPTGAAEAVPGFAVYGSLPTSMTVQGTGLTTSSGMPQLLFSDSNVNLISTLAATSVSPDGTTGTFPFPTKAGTTLGTGDYTFVVNNQTAPGVYSPVLSGAYSIGGENTQITAPYGVDAADVTILTGHCGGGRNPVCTSGGGTGPYSFVTSATASGSLYLDGAAVAINPVAVGSYPIAVRVYDVGTVSHNRPPDSSWQSTGPTKAIVSNYGSNNVSIIALDYDASGGFPSTVAATIPVGTEPCAITLNLTASKAYVANYGGSSVSEVDLTNNVVSRTIAVGSSPAAVVIDPGGTSLWVGGLNYISQIDLTSLATLNSIPNVTGQVTSMAISAGQSAVAYTSISANYSQFNAIQANLQSGIVGAAKAAQVKPEALIVTNKTLESASVAGSEYANPNPGKGAPAGFLTSPGALVSAPYGNRYVVLGTPTGFMLQDLQSSTTILNGSTTNAVLGIATDPGSGAIFLVVPASNAVYSVPFPPTS